MLCRLLFGCLIFSITCVAFAESPVDRSSKLELVSDDFKLADGPAWDGGSALYLPDVKGETLYRYTPKDGKRRVVLENAGRISASYFNIGTLYLSDNGNAQIARLSGKKKVRIAGQDPKAKPPARPNDLVVDAHGGIYYTLTSRGEVIYIAPDGTQSVAVEKVVTPNGITMSPDGQTLYVAAFVPKEIWSYQLPKPGKAEGGNLLAVMDDGDEKGADGMTIDRAGNVYCAGATDIWIWSPSGKLLDKIACPTRPINCAFGDQDMRTLYITGFGGLYRQRMLISGRSPHPRTTETNKVGQTKRPSTVLPADVVAHLDVVYAQYSDRKLLADIFVPQDAKERCATVVVVHGGGWKNGDKTKFRAIAVELAKRGYVTAAIEYRLADEAAFPAGIHDCNAAVRFLRANAKKFHVDPDRIGAVGGSAGGHLVGLMASGWQDKRLQGNGGNAEQSSRLQCAVVMAGPLQMTTGSVAERSRENPNQSNSNRWLRKSIDEDTELYKLADAHLHIDEQTPPIMFLTGEKDSPERNAASREKLKSLGIDTGLEVYPNAKHGVWNQLPWFNDFVEDIDTFCSTHLKRTGL